MFAMQKTVSRRRATLLAAAPLLALCAAGASTYVAFADEPTPIALSASNMQAPADLEQAFWTCDYVATTHGVHAAPVAFCSEVTAALQAQKFDGDFGRLLEWWKQNKPMQHATLESAGMATTASIR